MYLMMTIGCFTGTTTDVEGRLAELEGRLDDAEKELDAATTTIALLQTEVTDLGTRLSIQEQELDLLQTMVQVADGDLILGPSDEWNGSLPTRLNSEKDVILTDANLFIVNGEGNSASVNGEGNIIIGYNEPESGGVPNGECDIFSNDGSHNLIIGPANSWTSWGSAVVGLDNCSGSPLSTVLGVRNATESEPPPEGLDPESGANFVFGADNATFGAKASAVIGGNENESRGQIDVVIGGTQNKAYGATYFFGRAENPWPVDTTSRVEIGCADSNCTTVYLE